MRAVALEGLSKLGLAAGYGDSRATADHQMWQDVKGLDATGGVRPQNPVLDLEVRGAGLSERERPGGVGALCFFPCGPLLMTLQSAHGQRFRAFHAARPVHNFPSLALPTASG